MLARMLSLWLHYLDAIPPEVVEPLLENLSREV
jgi:hypothetical protein